MMRRPDVLLFQARLRILTWLKQEVTLRPLPQANLERIQ